MIGACGLSVVDSGENNGLVEKTIERHRRAGYTKSGLKIQICFSKRWAE
jgi:hypothetical protein